MDFFLDTGLSIRLVYDDLWSVVSEDGLCHGVLVRSVTGNDEWVFFSYDDSSLYYGNTQEAAVRNFLDS